MIESSLRSTARLQVAAALRPAAWAVPVVSLVALWLVLAFGSGGFLPRQWLLPALVLAFAGLAVFALGAFPARPGNLSLAVLGLLLLYVLWVALSATWALSVHRVWDEAGRSFFYLAFFALALAFLRHGSARWALRHALLGAATLLVLTAAWRLQTAGDSLPLLFTGKRFHYPLSYPNNAAALYLLFFWPLLWLAADPRVRAPLRGLALGTSAALMQLAFMTQSRGGFWALLLTAVVVFVLIPARVKLLFYLLVPLALFAYAFPDLNRYWVEGLSEVPGSQAASHLVVTLLVGGFSGMVLALLEGWVQVGLRLRMAFGGLVLVVLASSLIYGYVLFEREVGSPRAWASDFWTRFTADQTVRAPGFEGEASTRFVELGSSNRWDIWRVAWHDFRLEPWTGVGAGNFVFTHDQLRRNVNAKPRQPHSIELRVLAETGAPGALLFFGAVGLGLGGVLWPRFAAGWTALRGNRPGKWGGRPVYYAWPVALASGFVYWLVHGSVEWLWHMPGVTLGALLLLALALSEVEARAEFWPRLARFLGWQPRRKARAAEPAVTRGAAAALTRGVEAEGAGGPEPAVTVAAEPEAAGMAEPEGAVRADPEGAGSARRTRTSNARAAGRVRAAGGARAGSRVRAGRRVRAVGDARAAGLWPASLGSALFRWAGAALCLVLLVGLAFPYVSLRYQVAALEDIPRDPAYAVELAGTAASLRPYDPEPLLVEADAHRTLALTALEHGAPGVRGRAAASREATSHLAHALRATLQAAQREEVSWSGHYAAALAALDLHALRDPAAAVGTQAQEWAARVPGSSREPAPPSTDAGTGSAAPRQESAPAGYLSLGAGELAVLTPSQILAIAGKELRRAGQLNPLSGEVETLLQQWKESTLL